MKVRIQIKDYTWDGDRRGTKPIPGKLCHLQKSYFYADELCEWGELEEEFYAVLKFKKTSGLNNGRLYWWEAKTPVADGKVSLLPMGDQALVDILLNLEFVGVGIVDGKWRLYKHGVYLTIKPVIDKGDKK